jgi:hypothetical protein
VLGAEGEGDGSVGVGLDVGCWMENPFFPPKQFLFHSSRQKMPSLTIFHYVPTSRLFTHTRGRSSLARACHAEAGLL